MSIHHINWQAAGHACNRCCEATDLGKNIQPQKKKKKLFFFFWVAMTSARICRPSVLHVGAAENKANTGIHFSAICLQPLFP